MISRFLAVILLVGLPAVAVAQDATTQPAPAAVSVTSSTTQPATIVLKTETDKSETLGEVFGNTRVGQVFAGKRKVTLEDLRDPIFWVDAIRDLVVATLGFIPRIIVAFLFLVLFWIIYRTVRRLVLASMGKAAVDTSIRDMLIFLIKWSILGFGLVVAGNQVGVQIAALLTAAGVIGLAVGFAAQETLANFIAGIVIFWDKPFRVGDWLEIDATYGKVQRVTFRSTRLLDLNGHVVIYPNTYMLSNRVSNHSTHPLTRVAVPIGIAYKESIDEARKALLGVVQGDDRIATDPKPHVIVAACGASSVDLLLRFWVRDEGFEQIMVYEYVEKCKKALDAAGIAIPFPHVQVMLEETPAIEALKRAG